MSTARKMCLYKNCDKESGRTLFKFPTEKARFYAWVQCAGLELKGEINTDDPRYLCDKHFLSNYVSHQSRRKMLVHTAIPEKWKESLVIDEGDPKKFTIFSAKTPKSRKSSYLPRTSESDLTVSSAVLHNNLKRKYESTDEIDQIEYDDDEFSPIAESTEAIEEVYEEVTIPQPPKNKPVFIVVKPKDQPIPKKIMNYIRPAVTQKVGTTFFLTEEGNIETTANENNKPEKSKTPEKKQQEASAPLENCTEFIFNGEIYIQMPKRVFEEERDRLKAEIEKYKDVLMEIRSKTDLITDDNV